MTVLRLNPVTVCLSLLLSVVATEIAVGQQFRDPVGRYFPLNQSTPLGVAGQWHSLSAGTQIGSLQDVRFGVVGGGSVNIYQTPEQSFGGPAPTQVRLAVGHSYRLRLSDIPDHAGVELYPSIEILDRLHPPAGSESAYPVPVEITKDEIEAAIAGRLVTKVVYLEPPRRAVGLPRSIDEATATVPNRVNLLAEADVRGRPMLILRLGSRTPGPGAGYRFFGTGGPVEPSATPVPQQRKTAFRPHGPSTGRARVSMLSRPASFGS